MPNPATSAIQGLQTQSELYPYQYLIDALSQTGGSGTVTDPLTGNPTTLNFQGLGTADVQNQQSAQMAQTLLQIQNTLGPEYVQLALQNLQQSDPQGFAAYNQAWQQIQQQAAQPTPNIGLAQGTQADIQNLLNSSQSLSPSALSDVQQSVRGNQVASGLDLGNAPAAAEASAVVNATDQQNAAVQNEAGAFLQSGNTPLELQQQQLQQDMANYGAYINGQSPTTQASQPAGAQYQVAPQGQTGFSPSTLNEGASGQMGISNAFGIASANNEWNSQQANPYLAGLNLAGQGLGVAASAGAFNSSPQSQYSNYPINIPASGSQPAGAYNPYTPPGGDWSNLGGYQ